MGIVNEITIRGYLRNEQSLTGSVHFPTTVVPDYYNGPYEYTPMFVQQIAPTANKYLRSDILIDSIQTYETSNEYGTTFII